MWPEILALEVQNVQAVALITVVFRRGQPRDIQDLNEMVYIMLLEYGGIEDCRDRSKVESARVRGLRPQGRWRIRRKDEMHGGTHCFRNIRRET
jgi:hypothetical protein